MDTPNNPPDWQQLADEYLAGWKRAKADFINLQNGLAKERNEWIEFATARALERLLPAVDTLRAAAGHLPELIDVLRKFDEYLASEGVAEIPAEGKFDHSFHEAVGKEKREGIEPDTVVEVVQKGYKLNERLLRPAKVIVAE
jgi:molecular chaperone GrpE